MAAGVTWKPKRKAGAFSGGDLASGEVGLDTTNGVWYYSPDGSTVTALGGGGKVAQVVTTEDSTVKTSTVSFPLDTSIPQNTDGDAYSELDTTITPTNAGSSLLVLVSLSFSGTATSSPHAAVFRDSGSDALRTKMVTHAAGWHSNLDFSFSLPAGSTAATTFKIRYGRQSGTLYVNSGTATAFFGGTLFSSLTIMEILP